MANTTPTIRCPQCEHPIDNHRPDEPCNTGHISAEICQCRMTPNLIAVAHLFGGLTPTSDVPRSVSRQPDGSWA